MHYMHTFFSGWVKYRKPGSTGHLFPKTPYEAKPVIYGELDHYEQFSLNLLIASGHIVFIWASDSQSLSQFVITFSVMI